MAGDVRLTNILMKLCPWGTESRFIDADHARIGRLMLDNNIHHLMNELIMYNDIRVHDVDTDTSSVPTA